MHKTFVLYILSVLLISSCSNSKNQMTNDTNNDVEKTQPIVNKNNQVKYEQLTFKENGSGSPDKNLVLKNQDKFEMAWKSAHQKMNPIPTSPTINFEKESVLFIDFGQNSHGDMVYNIKDIEINKNTALVTFKKPAMDDNMLVTTVMTRPFMFIKINNTEINQVQVK